MRSHGSPHDGHSRPRLISGFAHYTALASRAMKKPSVPCTVRQHLDEPVADGCAYAARPSGRSSTLEVVAAREERRHLALVLLR